MHYSQFKSGVAEGEQSEHPAYNGHVDSVNLLYISPTVAGYNFEEDLLRNVHSPSYL